MKEHRAGLGRPLAGIAGSIGGALRRRRQAREPRVVLYDAAGRPRAIAPSEPGYDELLQVAGRMSRLVPADRRPPDKDRRPPARDERG